jgi:hypothetical protein
LYDETDYRNDNRQTQDFDETVREDAQEQERRTFALLLVQQAINPF